MLHTVAFYNVENLYDINRDPSILDSEYTFSGNKSWTLNRYQNKLMRIAKAISKIGEDETDRLPTFFGLCEIENKKVIEDLLKEFPFKANYGYVHTDSLDERGIDTAFFYNKEFFTVEEKDFLRFYVLNHNGSRDFTRDITYVKGKIHNTIMYFFVLHLPSKRNNNINRDKRIYLLQELRKKINTIFETDSKANIIIMGDFNENPIAPYIYEELKVKKKIEELHTSEFYNPFEEIYRNGGFSLYYEGKGLLFDQILTSSSFYAQESPLKIIKSQIYNASYLQEPERKKIGKPWRTYQGNRYVGGYSDHFPVYTVIEIEN
ncbi:endonuclease [Apibacter sp. HY039]|uniref:endonuclease/exonuclease/phosphatase family protein n=1 Tax=Apibacter sp. HY039 TaxID=2501476 RepID=UPI000FEBCED8|nr:endonuclease [Apibacter sp. HY039]